MCKNVASINGVMHVYIVHAERLLRLYNKLHYIEFRLERARAKRFN